MTGRRMFSDMNLILRARHTLADDRGSAAMALGFTLLAATLITVMASLAVGVSMTAGAAAATSSMNGAIDGRYDRYLTELRAGGTPSVAEVCAPATRTCSTITGATGTTTVTVTLTASYANGAYTDTQVRRYVARAGSIISGFDSDNDPVWAP